MSVVNKSAKKTVSRSNVAPGKARETATVAKEAIVRAGETGEARRRAKLERDAERMQERMFYQAVGLGELVNAARLFTPRHYEEVVEERVHERLCGYPLCNKEPRSNLPPLKILSSRLVSTDDMRRYCSNNCMTSSRYYAGQLDEEPAWAKAVGNQDASGGKVDVVPLGVDLKTHLASLPPADPLRAYISSLISSVPRPDPPPPNPSSSPLPQTPLAILERTTPDGHVSNIPSPNAHDILEGHRPFVGGGTGGRSDQRESTSAFKFRSKSAQLPRMRTPDSDDEDEESDAIQRPWQSVADPRTTKGQPSHSNESKSSCR
ncbi:hypothetical protein M427DRAFT_456246 [Gonapodya prolifera JEL478]|uniref:RNA polymerase II subunit B1 CTD phosphatase RPAP2 homolog n=1 Tax=Gonapodya prolifera (strain JEL478) TaxID=1344416 RepID=A0A139A2M3_GONPJ|nr:hypothetical protein M427DRAFT_456246 [Gonapodya prolifera JEL478]|eukprot:KXS11036.1 hypothetical protein M427DRAFT_456246 [Gonapodya prolifera JEL478]